MGARNGYHAGVGEVAVCCGDSDGCRAFLYAGNLTGCFVYSGNSGVVRLKRNGLVRSFCRINGVTRGLRLTCLDRQGFINGNACYSYGFGFNRNRSRNDGEAVCVVFECLARAKFQIRQPHRYSARETIIHFALKCR